MPNNLNQTIAEITTITNLAAHTAYQELFKPNIQELSNNLAQEQLNQFIDINRGNLQINQTELDKRKAQLQYILQSNDLHNKNKITYVLQLGTSFLLTKILLSFKNQTIVSADFLSKMYETIRNLQIISHTPFFGFIEPEFLEYVAITAWDLSEFWLITAIADLDFHFYQSTALKKAREIAKHFTDQHIFEKLSLIVAASDKVYQHKETDKSIEDSKQELSQQLNIPTIVLTIKKAILVRKSAEILLRIAKISCPNDALTKITTKELEATRLVIHNLETLLQVDLVNNLTILELECLYNSAMHLCEPWVIALLFDYNLATINPNISTIAIQPNSVGPKTTTQQAANINLVTTQATLIADNNLEFPKIIAKPKVQQNPLEKNHIQNHTLKPITQLTQTKTSITPSSNESSHKIQEGQEIVIATQKSISILDIEQTKQERKHQARIERNQRKKDAKLQAKNKKQAELEQKLAQEKLLPIEDQKCQQEELTRLEIETKPQAELLSSQDEESNIPNIKDKTIDQSLKKALKKEKRQAARELKKKNKSLATLDTNNQHKEEKNSESKEAETTLEEKLNHYTNNFDYQSINSMLEKNPQLMELVNTEINKAIKKNSNTPQEFIEKIHLNMRTCCLLLYCDKVNYKTKLSLIKNIINNNHKSKTFFPFNKIFSFLEQTKHVFKQLPNDDTNIDIKKSLIQTEVNYATLTIDPSDTPLHHFMRHTPDDFEVLDLILPKYATTITQQNNIAKHTVNKKGQNFLHVLMEHESVEKIIKTITYLLSKKSLFISHAALFKDNDNYTPINILEARFTQTIQAINLLEQLMMPAIIDILAKNMNITQIRNASVSDVYGNSNSNNIFCKLIDNNEISTIQLIIARRHAFRDNVIEQALKELNLYTTLTSEDKILNNPNYMKIVYKIQVMISYNEYNSVKVKVKNLHLINVILDLRKTAKEHKELNELLKSKDFIEALKSQPLTKSLPWFMILHKFILEKSYDFDKIYTELLEYVEYSGVDPNKLDNNANNLLDQMLQFTQVGATLDQSIQMLDFCCKKLSIKVEERNLIRQVSGIYRNKEYAYDTLKYLLNNFDKNKIFQIGCHENKNLLFYAAIDGQSPAMVKCLIEYGFASKQSAHILLAIIEQYRAGKIEAHIVLELLNTLLDDQLVPQELQLTMLTYSDAQESIACLMKDSDENPINQQILELVSSKKTNLSKTNEKKLALKY
jgi:hypothetical protein